MGQVELVSLFINSTVLGHQFEFDLALRLSGACSDANEPSADE
jgi:hypothetical protein